MSIKLEKQLKDLQACDIKLRSGFTVDHLLSVSGRAEYENKPYLLLLTVMGGELEEEPYAHFSNDIWHFDTEGIEGDGAYVAIARRMSELAGEALPLTDINDYVDIEEGVAWLSFKIDGREIKWEAAVDDDWVDTEIISKFADLLAGRGTGILQRWSRRRFTYIDMGGQDCLIGCSTMKHFKNLRSTTGLNVEWLA
jgi:hypothetical protein